MNKSIEMMAMSLFMLWLYASVWYEVIRVILWERSWPKGVAMCVTFYTQAVCVYTPMKAHKKI